MQRTTTQRGYGSAHQQARQRYARTLPTQCTCDRPDCPHHQGRCPTILTADQPWHLGHTEDRTGYTGPECPQCNTSDGGRRGRAIQTGKNQVFTQDW